MTSPQWHFPRREFTQEVFDRLTRTPAHAATLFGPRRTGKTEFLIRDLAPFAESRGHRVAYASFWQTPENPLTVLLYALDRALNDGSFLGRMREHVRKSLSGVEINIPGIGAAKIDSTTDKPFDGKGLLHLDRYCEALSNTKHPTFLLFDEFQALEDATGSHALIAALRTSLDTRREGLVSLFTGSSQAGLHRVFSKKDAPFYRFATPLTLPRLESDFVDHQIKTARNLSTRHFSSEKALEVFERLDASPMIFQRWIEVMMTQPDLSAEDAVDTALRGIGEQAGFGTTWQKLSLRQRAITYLLATGTREIFAELAAKEISRLADCDDPRDTQVQSDLRRLKRLGLAENHKRKWDLSDPLFEIWVRNRPDLAN